MIPFYLFAVKFRNVKFYISLMTKKCKKEKPECQISRSDHIVQDHIIEYLFS